MPLRDAAGKVFGLLGIYDDITTQRQNEESLQRLNRALRTLSASNEALVRIGDERELLTEATRIITEIGGYPVAWVGYARDDGDGKTIEPMAWAGAGQAALGGAKLSWADDGWGQEPVSRAIRLGTRQLGNGTTDETPEIRRLRYDTGASKCLALPLRLSSETAPFGALAIGGADSSTFDPDEVKLLDELAADLAYGIENIRTHVQRAAGVARLRRALESTVAAMAATVEARDPYTAGHEQRVAQLSEAIARHMELPESTIEGIRFGALIHDLGKIQVPAELLAKPTKLTAIEFELIKTHPQAGFDILKNIEFPWPVAQIVVQHHERLDGSGYPNHLTGDAIGLEARIVAVADVVEAMGSHRPYRPSRGMDAALAEIERGRGTLFDPAVVDACLTVFREKGFAFT